MESFAFGLSPTDIDLTELRDQSLMSLYVIIYFLIFLAI